jgi:hypothetical protein
VPLSGRPALPILILTLGLLPGSPATGRSAVLAESKGDRPNAWTIKVTVEARGEYGLEGREERVSGSYELAFVWTGALEQDGEDYLLLHDRCDLVRWTIEERATTPSRITLLTAADIGDRPELKVNYVLRTKEGVKVDLFIRGFDVPHAPAPESFYLQLPASAENRSRTDGLDYDLSVTTGSNSVVLDDGRIRRGAENASFEWTWRRRSWVQRQDQTLLLTNGHEATVTVEVREKRSP